MNTIERMNIYLTIKHKRNLPNRQPEYIKWNNTMFFGGGGTSMGRCQQSTKSSTTRMGNGTSSEIQKQWRE